MMNMNSKEIIYELNNIVEKYKSMIINEYNKIDLLNHKIILMSSILNRSTAIIEAYKKLMETNNIIVLNSLIRMQIDNCIFIYGVYLLIQNGYSIDVILKEILLNNKKLSSYKINKNKLYDKYIILEIDKEYNNRFKEMYEFYCSFIHFSHKALLTSILVQNESAIEISLSKDFARFKEEVLENSESFIELSKFLLILLSQKWKDIDSGSAL